MPLLEFWKNNKDVVLNMGIEQVVANAGDGNLRDGTESSAELRKFLAEVKSERLFDYARHCLETSFNRGPLVLQDVVNEFGRRLGFDVENGLYQGKRNAIGFDGIWRSDSETDLIIEVKTTDTYSFSLDTLAQYKQQLVEQSKVSRTSSNLIVVGREDTGALEAQIRGSRYAWEMRLISVERIIKLVQVKEKSNDPATLQQIRQLLQPFEYTKIDRIIDVIFTTAADVESQEDAIQQTEAEVEGDAPTYTQERTAPELLNAKRQQAIEAFGALKKKELVKYSRTLFWSADKQLRVCCAVSKRYDNEYQPYWYAFHPQWDEFLAQGSESYFVLSCMDRDEAYAVPYGWLKENKQNLNMTDRGDRSYWHLALTSVGDDLAINVSKIGVKQPLKSLAFSLLPLN